MRLRSGLAVLALVLAGCASSQASPKTVSDAPGPCAPPSARVVAADRVAEVYQPSQSRGIFGCAGLGGQSYRLGSTGPCNGSDRIGPVALAGAGAAYGIERCGVDTGTSQVVVRRLTNGVILRTASATSRVPGPESFQSVGSVVVKPDGVVAWIGESHSIVGHRAVIEVHRIDRRGAAELDHGAGIAVGSLRLRGSRLSWAHARSTRSATLS